MKFSTLLASLALLAVPVFTTTVSYDTLYDNAAGSLNTVACSDGPFGLEQRGYTTFGSLPHFPNIGGAFAVADRNSPACGTCWRLTYVNPRGVSKSINIIAIDHAGPDTFNIALSAMNALTDNQAVALGRVTVTANQVDASVCGL
ncbi:hypothetical protein AX15_005020 [Amanita polypyramis BW_CC]|nr:hypothetical protein AX15_005020 [Amanita polypyramis BW_CC]